MSTFDENQHPRGQAGNAGQFREKANSAPSTTLEATAASELCTRCGENEPAQYESICKGCMWETCDECGADIDSTSGSSTCSDCSADSQCRECGEPNDVGEGWDGLCGNCADRASCARCGDEKQSESAELCTSCQEEESAEAETLTIGAGATRISAAQARRELAEGARVQPVYLRPQRAGDAAPAPRTVTKQTPHEMITVSDDHPDGVHLTWKGSTAQRDANGTVIISDDEGQPYVAFVPLADGQDPHPNPGIDLPEVHDFIEARESTSETALHRVAARATTDAVRRAIARNGHASGAALDVVAQTATGRGAQEAIVEHPNVLGKTLATLAQSEHYEVRYRVAAHPRTDATTLAQLAGDSKDGVRIAAARHANTPTTVLDALADSRDGDLRTAVASNPNTSPEVLERLSHGNGYTMANVASNPSAPEAAIRRLWEDRSTGNQTRAMVASNPSAPPEIIAAAVTDQDDWVRRHAARNLALTSAQEAALAADSEQAVRRAVASNSSRPEALAILARDKDPFVRGSVARNAETPADVIRALAGDDAGQVRMSVAQHRNTPASVLAAYAGGDDRAASIARDRLERG